MTHSFGRWDFASVGSYRREVSTNSGSDGRSLDTGDAHSPEKADRGNGCGKRHGSVSEVERGKERERIAR